MWLVVLLALAAAGRVGLVEDHNHVLWHALDAVSDGTLPKEGVTLLHFDSHADMSLVETGWFEAAQMFLEPFQVVRRTEINNWVTAIWVLGIVNRMVFVEPPWGKEFRQSRHDRLIFTIGRKGDDFKLHVRTPEGEDVSSDYYHIVSDHDMPNYEKFVQPEEMTETREVDVQLLRLEDDLVSNVLQFVESSTAIMLSVDMDVFSTESPSHLWMLREAEIPLRFQHWLVNKYWNMSYDQAWWKQALQADTIKHCPDFKFTAQDEQPALQVNVSQLRPVEYGSHVERLYDLTWGRDPSQADREEILRVWQLFEPAIRKLGGSFDEDTIATHFANLIRYPVYQSSASTVRYLQSVLRCLFSRMAASNRTPQLITLSRSPEYLPLHYLEDIECNLLNMIRTEFPSLTALHYESTIRDLYPACKRGFTTHAVEAGSAAYTFGEVVPVDLVMHNESPEPLKIFWGNNPQYWREREVVASGELADAVTQHGHYWQFRTLDGFVVGEYQANAERGHTVRISITTGQVDAALAKKGIFRHRDV